MALFQNVNFNPEVFGKYVERVPNLNRSELIKSKALRRRPDIAAMFSEQTGGNYATTPLFGMIGGAAANYDGLTDTPVNTTGTFTQSRVVVGRQNSWVESDFACDIASTDFMDEVGKQIAEYWDNVDQQTILAILKGVFSMEGEAEAQFIEAHTSDITSDGDGCFKETTINNAIRKACGDNKQKFTLAIMHSVVATNLENLQLMSYLKYTDPDGISRDLALGTVGGKLVLIDDGMPTETQDDGSTVYTTYILGEGAIEYSDCGAEVPYELYRDPKTGGGQTTLFSRQRKCFAPYGVSFTKAEMASLSPTDAELENGRNWALCDNGKTGEARETVSHKAIPIARVISRG